MLSNFCDGVTLLCVYCSAIGKESSGDNKHPLQNPNRPIIWICLACCCYLSTTFYLKLKWLVYIRNYGEIHRIKVFKGTVVNRALQTFIGWSIKIMLTFSLRILKQIYAKDIHYKLTKNQNKICNKTLSVEKVVAVKLV